MEESSMISRRLSTFALALALSFAGLGFGSTAVADPNLPNTSCVMADGSVVYGLTEAECEAQSGEYFRGIVIPNG